MHHKWPNPSTDKTDKCTIFIRRHINAAVGTKSDERTATGSYVVITITNCLFPQWSGEAFRNRLFPQQFSDYG